MQFSKYSFFALAIGFISLSYNAQGQALTNGVFDPSKVMIAKRQAADLKNVAKNIKLANEFNKTVRIPAQLRQPEIAFNQNRRAVSAPRPQHPRQQVPTPPRRPSPAPVAVAKRIGNSTPVRNPIKASTPPTSQPSSPSTVAKSAAKPPTPAAAPKPKPRAKKPVAIDFPEEESSTTSPAEPEVGIQIGNQSDSQTKTEVPHLNSAAAVSNSSDDVINSRDSDLAYLKGLIEEDIRSAPPRPKSKKEPVEAFWPTLVENNGSSAAKPTRTKLPLFSQKPVATQTDATKKPQLFQVSNTSPATAATSTQLPTSRPIPTSSRAAVSTPPTSTVLQIDKIPTTAADTPPAQQVANVTEPIATKPPETDASKKAVKTLADVLADALSQ